MILLAKRLIYVAALVTASWSSSYANQSQTGQSKQGLLVFGEYTSIPDLPGWANADLAPDIAPLVKELLKAVRLEQSDVRFVFIHEASLANTLTSHSPPNPSQSFEHLRIRSQQRFPRQIS